MSSRARTVASSCLLLLTTACWTYWVPDPRAAPPTLAPPPPHPGVYVTLRTDGPHVDFAALLEHCGDFKDVSDEPYVYPVGIRIRQQARPMSSAGTTYAKSLLSALTLRLIPFVDTGELETRFQIEVGGEIAFEYVRTVPYHSMLWLLGGFQGGSAHDAGQRAAADAVAAFIAELRANPKAQALLREYDASRAAH
jgi:hypothetical protein